MLDSFSEKIVDPLDVFRLRFGLAFENYRGIELAQSYPERGIVALDASRALQRLHRFFGVTPCQFDFIQALIGVEILWVERYRLIRVFQGLFCLLEILRVNERKLQVRRWFLGLRLDRVLQDIDRTRKIFLSAQ